MQEQELVIEIDLDSLLRRLNYLVTEFPMFYGDLSVLEEATSNLDAKQLKKFIKFITVDLQKQANAGKHRAPTYTSQPDALFKAKATPWIGEKKSLNLYNKDFVIGLRDSTDLVKYRLDYDPKKLLHVNLYLFEHSFSITVAPRSKTFDAQSTGENRKIEPVNEEGQMVKFKYWTKMTVAFHAYCLAGANSQYTFPLCSALEMSFEGLKKELAMTAVDEDLVGKILKCASKKSLSSLIYSNKELRDYLVYRVIENRTESICFYDANEDINSETLSDSSPLASPVKHKREEAAAVGPGAGVRFSSSAGKEMEKKPLPSPKNKK